MISVSDAVFAAAAERLPSTPQIFGRVNQALRNPDVEVDEIAHILRLDAALSARLLRLGNSAAAAAPANDLGEAVQRIGFREVFRVVGLAMAGQLYISGLPLYGVGGTELWENSVSTALAVEKLTAGTDEDPRIAFILGLLRPVGRLLMQRLATGQVCAPFAARKATGALVQEWERTNFSLDSTQAAVRLFALWKLPSGLRAPLECHFAPVEHRGSEGARLGALLHVAGAVAESLGHGLAIERAVWSLSPEVLALAGVDRDRVDVVAEETKTALRQSQALVG